MKVKTAFLLVLVLALQPSFANPEKTAWYEEPSTLMAVGAIAATGYFAGGRLGEGVSKVLPKIIATTLFAGVSGYTVLSRRFNLPWVAAALPAIALVSFVLWKSLKTCPVTGGTGCCCHLTKI